jgi:hypothetical protein
MPLGNLRIWSDARCFALKLADSEPGLPGNESKAHCVPGATKHLLVLGDRDGGQRLLHLLGSRLTAKALPDAIEVLKQVLASDFACVSRGKARAAAEGRPGFEVTGHGGFGDAGRFGEQTTRDVSDVLPAGEVAKSLYQFIV